MSFFIKNNMLGIIMEECQRQAYISVTIQEIIDLYSKYNYPNTRPSQEEHDKACNLYLFLVASGIYKRFQGTNMKNKPLFEDWYKEVSQENSEAAHAGSAFLACYYSTTNKRPKDRDVLNIAQFQSKILKSIIAYSMSKIELNSRDKESSLNKQAPSPFLNTDQTNCPSCGKPISSTILFCKHCGFSINSQTQTTKKVKVTRVNRGEEEK